MTSHLLRRMEFKNLGSESLQVAAWPALGADTQSVTTDHAGLDKKVPGMISNKSKSKSNNHSRIQHPKLQPYPSSFFKVVSHPQLHSVWGPRCLFRSQQQTQSECYVVIYGFCTHPFLAPSLSFLPYLTGLPGACCIRPFRSTVCLWASVPLPQLFPLHCGGKISQS